MLNENNAQISLEYLLVISISLIILISFTMPLLEFAISNTLDVSDSLNVKSDMSKISSAISQVYGEGQGSRQTVVVFADSPYKISVSKNTLSATVKLNDKSSNVIKTFHNSNFGSYSIDIVKGKNRLVIEWPAGGEMMISK